MNLNEQQLLWVHSGFLGLCVLLFMGAVFINTVQAAYIGSYATSDTVTLSTFYRSAAGVPTKPDLPPEISISCTDGTTWAERLARTPTSLRVAASVYTATHAAGTTTTLTDTALTEADNFWKGYLLRMTSGGNAGLEAMVTGFVASTDTLTFSNAMPFNIATTDDYELLRPVYAYSWAVTGVADGDRCHAIVQAVSATASVETFEFSIDDTLPNIRWPLFSVATDVGNTSSLFKTTLTQSNDFTTGKKPLIGFPYTTESVQQSVTCNVQGEKGLVELYNTTTKVITLRDGLSSIPDATCQFRFY